jgi:uncharacterized protein (UPF0335 family)
MNIGANSRQQLKSIIERVENLNEEIARFKGDVKDIYAEAKANGYDVPTLRAIVKRRAEDADKRAEKEALLDAYLAALGQLDGTPLGRSAVEREFA